MQRKKNNGREREKKKRNAPNATRADSAFQISSIRCVCVPDKKFSLEMHSDAFVVRGNVIIQGNRIRK